MVVGPPVSCDDAESMGDTGLGEQLTRLPEPLPGLLRGVAGAALARGAAPYLVGGGVRDLLLGRDTADLDIVVVGDAPAIAGDLARQFGADLTVHERFGTATLAPPGWPQLDLITARREGYPAPGALPVVTPGGLDDDLRRRDFTINAIAASLDPASFGRLVDPLGGRADLARGLVRALHPGSFRDDPTRMLRAIRYAGRLAFAIEPLTAAWLRAAIDAGAAGAVSIDRLAHEFVRLLAEPAPAVAPMVARLAESGLLAQLHPALNWDVARERAFAALDPLWLEAAALNPPNDPAPPLWAARLALLVAHLDPAGAEEAAAALHLPSDATKLAGEVARLRQRLAATPPDAALPASALGRLLDPYSPAAVVTVAALRAGDDAGWQLRRYLTAIRPLAPVLTGHYLRALGVPPGPVYREALAALRDRKRDDPALTPEGEAAFLRGWLAARDLLPGGATGAG